MNDLELRLRAALNDEAASVRPDLPPFSSFAGPSRMPHRPTARWAAGLAVAGTLAAVVRVAGEGALPGLGRDGSGSDRGQIASSTTPVIAARTVPQGPPQAPLPRFEPDTTPAGPVTVAARIATAVGVREIVTFRTADGTFCWFVTGQPRSGSGACGNNQTALVAQADHPQDHAPRSQDNVDLAFGIAPQGTTTVTLFGDGRPVTVPTVATESGGHSYTFFLAEVDTVWDHAASTDAQSRPTGSWPAKS